MYDIDLNRYTEVVDSAIALRPQIEKAVDEICAQGYSNLFFIGCGGTYAHSLPMMYWLESTTNKVEAHAVIAAEFMVMGHKAFSKDSVCIFSTRSGNTKEIVAAAKFCKEAGGAFDKYDEFMAQYAGLTKYLIAGKEKFDPFCQELAKKFKDVDYHMVIGGGMLWGEAYDYAMCILEEMQWIRTKSIHVCEYFHGTLELVEKDTSLILFYGEDETRPLMDRVLKFSKTVSNEITIFDTKEVELPFTDPEFRKIVSPIVIYAITERLSAHLAKERNHPLTTRRYYRQMEY